MAETVIIDIKVSNAEAVKEIEQSTAAINDLKEQEKELREERIKGNVTREEYYKKLTVVREETERHKQNLTTYRKALKDNIKTEREEADSLNRMRQTLRQTLGEYDKLSKAEREGAKGQEMLKHIQDLTNELNEAEQASGRFQRQVGNYPAAFKGFEKYLPLLQGGIKGVTANLAAMGKQLLKLLANPIVAAVAAAVVVFQKLREAIKRNDNASTALQKVFAAFKPILDVLRKGLDAVVTVIGKVAEGFAKVVNWVTKLIPGMREFADAEQDLVAATDRLEETERRYTVDSAKRSAEVSELKAKAADKEKYSAQERIDMLNQAAELEKQDLAEAKAIAEEKLRLAREQQKVTNDTSDETENNIAQLQAAVYQAEQAYNDGMRSIVKQTNAAVKEIGAEEQQAIKEAEQRRKEAAQRAKQRRETELKERRAAEDAALALVAESVDKEKQLIDLNAARQVEDLQKRLKEERDLTVKARRAIEEQITLIRAKAAIEREAVDKRVEAERAQRQLEYERLLAQQGAEATKMYFDAQALAEKNAYERRLQAARGNAEELAWIAQQEAEKELLAAKNKQASILRINYETEEAYKLAMEQATAEVIAAENKAREAAENTADAVKMTAEAVKEAQKDLAGYIGDAASSFEELFNSMAETDSRYKDYATAMAAVQLLTSQAVALASAIEGAVKAASATGPTAPFVLAGYIAQMVGIVTASIAQARQLLNQASTATPKYATGGVIHGAGTGTSDSITARVSNGESILTAKATSMFYDQLSAMNVAGGGRPFDHSGGRRFAQGGVVSTSTLMSGRQTQAMAEAMREAVSGIQPVVSVREITSVANKVQVKEKLAQQ